MTTPPDISVVIVSWNTRELLDDCLRSLYSGGLCGLSSEVWVVDNASSDGSTELVQAKYPNVKLIRNTENVGFARANNQALRQAKGRYLLLLNSDTVVPANALYALFTTMEASPSAAVGSPFLQNGDGSPQIGWSYFPVLRSELSGRLDRTQSPYPLADYNDAAKRAQMQPFPVDWVGGACFLVRTTAVESVGLLDEGFFMYSEETDWCWRFRRAGWSVLLVPAVTVTHLGGQSAKAVPLATRQRLYRSSLRLYRRIYGPVGALLPSVVAAARYILFRLKHRL